MHNAPQANPSIAVVIHCYKVTRHVVDVLRRIGPEVTRIYLIDDGCPEASGDHASRHCSDPRLRIVQHATNQGVGGAVMSGYSAAINDGMDIIVKIDGDGQMDPALIAEFTGPIAEGRADYAKGNRFFFINDLRAMPPVRILGNAALSFMSKLSSGYWNIFDPANGYTAIHADVARHLPLEAISRRYFFESDMLFQLYLLRAVVVDVPMQAHYADEVSNLRIRRIIGEFAVKHLRNFMRRIFYTYYLRDLSPGSPHLPVGLGIFGFGICFGVHAWMRSVETGLAATAGTVMLAALPIMLGLQLLLAFLSQDMILVPTRPVSPALKIAGRSRQRPRSEDRRSNR